MAARNSVITETEEKPKRPAFWVAVVGLSQAWKLILSIASSVILGRLLLPADFGLVAMISPLVAMADLLRDLGFTQAVVQRQSISRGQVNSLFWLSFMVTVLIAVCLSAISPLVAAFFKEPRLTLLLIVTAWTLLLGTMSALPIAWLNRDLRFTAIAIIESCASAVSLAAAAACAWFTHSYWSLALAGAAYSATAALLAIWLSGWRPGLPSFDKDLKDMAKFGAGVSTANIGNFIARNADNLLIAKVSGPVPLGLYDRAYKLMLVPLSQITWPISRVLTPLLARQLNQPEEYRKTYFSAITYLLLLGQPGLLFCVVFSPSVVHLLLGSKWDQVAPIFAWLGAAALQQLVTSSIVWLFISQGRGRDYATLGITNSAVAVLSFVIGVHWGPLGVAISFTLFDFIVRFPFSWWFTTRRGPVGLKAATATLLPHGMAVGISALLLMMGLRLMHHLSLPQLILGTLFTYVAYISVLAAWPSKRRLLVLLIEKLLQRARRYTAAVTI